MDDHGMIAVICWEKHQTAPPLPLKIPAWMVDRPNLAQTASIRNISPASGEFPRQMASSIKI